ncbi:hypothetical protein BDN70DRAFT_885898 [Pholiota conissans]|uniref:Citrate transporter-like domain-containing protein n=1 Tax=Pholiota conissans TaxID=109636 RepID=A0A9P5YQR9_9AGAR|nr:hypothetical protein BDN70DRAFT_885898 [Pholiota conissans]
MVSGSAIGTLVVFILSIICVIRPLSFPILLPVVGRKRIHLNLTTAPIIAILILWAAQCLGPSVIRDGIVGTDGVKPYNILILFFSLAYMAITLDITGILQAAAFWVSNKGGSDGWKLFIYFYMMLTALSVLLGNDPVILSGTAFLVYYTKVNELEPIAWLMSEFAAANTASMVLFVGNPTNVVVCEGFRINNAAFTAYTILPFLACIITSFIALAAQFHKSKYLPRRLANSGDLDVRSVLLDPRSAWVGSILLGTCLVVIIIVSFFHVDVWKISLPFAVAKFVYDFAWDHYRHVHKIPLMGQARAKTSDEDLTEIENNLVLQELSQKHRSSVQSADVSKAYPEGYPLPERLVTFDSELNPPIVPSATQTRTNTRSNTQMTARTATTLAPSLRQPPEHAPTAPFPTFQKIYNKAHSLRHRFATHFPTFYTAFPRLPFALVPFAFSQFILIEALAHQGWIEIFARWLVIATGRLMYPTVWVIGVLGVILCNLSGTNIGATILLTKIVRAAILSAPADTDVNLDAFNRAAGIALAVASNIGAVSFTFSASLAGLLWKQILNQKGIFIKQWVFAKWNLLPLTVMTVVGLAVVSAEMAVLF